jgi:hypothetical protein
VSTVYAMTRVLVMRRSGVRLPKAAPSPLVSTLIAASWTDSWNERVTGSALVVVNSSPTGHARTESLNGLYRGRLARIVVP